MKENENPGLYDLSDAEISVNLLHNASHGFFCAIYVL